LNRGDEVWIDDAVEEETRALLEDIEVCPRAVMNIPAMAASKLGRPTGAKMVLSAESTLIRLPAADRATLLSWARGANAWIVERIDDVGYIEEGRAMPCLQSLDPERVLIAGRFNSAVSSCVRLGYLVVPAHLAGAFAGARYVTDGDLPVISQRVLATYIGRGHLQSFKKLCATDDVRSRYP
jgi:GntR family transcriptional regulator/MocR family aminotransferase